jgi:type IV fimbrial biogenesis protein FimT
MLSDASARPSRGFSLIELLVGITILAFTLGLAAPAFADWIRNARVRSTAEAVQDGLYFARSEAARRNAIVRFQLTSSLDNACVLSDEGPDWVVTMSVSESPAGHCGAAIGDTATPYLLKKSPVVSSMSKATLTGSREVLAFDGLGQLNSLGGATAITAFQIDIQSSDGTCVADGGRVQCLRVIVRPGGEISMCDPSPLHSSTDDPLTCPDLSEG